MCLSYIKEKIFGKLNNWSSATRSSSHKERRLVSWNGNFKKVQGITLAIKWIMIRIRIIIKWLGIARSCIT